MPLVEQILASAAERNPARAQYVEGRRVAACVVDLRVRDHGGRSHVGDHDDAEGAGVAWCRAPEGADVSDVVAARLITGAHTAPDDVLRWLQGQASRPWPDGDDLGDAGVLDELARKLRQP